MPNDEELQATQLDGADFEGETFRGQRFLGVSARNAKLVDCTFEECILSSVAVDGASLRVRFRNCKLEGINFFVAKRALMELAFEDCLIRHCSFASLVMKRATMVRCTFEDVDFADADMSGADFAGSRFERCEFKATNLMKADFRGATGYMIDPTRNAIAHAKFDIPEVLSLLAGFDIEID